MFKFITDTAQSLVDVTCDSVDYVMGDGDGPSRNDVANLLAAGMTVAAVAAVTGLAVDVIEEIRDGD